MSVAPRANGKLTITVHEGKDLTNKDVGKQDPFVKIKLAEESHKTKTHKKGGKEPKWKESFLFNVKDFDLKEKVFFEVWDEDSLSNDKIGLASVPIDSLVKEAHKEDGYWFQLHAFDDNREIAGYIRVSVVAEGSGFHPVAESAIKKLEEKVEGIKHKVEERREEAEKKKEEPKKEEPKKELTTAELEPVKLDDDKKGGDTETRIQAVHSKQWLGISGASDKDGAEVHQWDADTTQPHFYFQFIERKDGTYEIVAKHSGKLVTAEKDGDGVKVHQHERSGAENQRWILSRHDDGSFRISSAVGYRSLDVLGASTHKGHAVGVHSAHDKDNQKFILDKPPSQFWTVPSNGFETKIQAKQSTLYLDVNGGSQDDNAHVIQWQGHTSANQVFVFHDRKDGSVEITAKHSGKYLAVKDDNKSTKVTQHSTAEGAHSRWLVKNTGPNTYVIYNVGSGFAWGIQGGSTKQGKELRQWPFEGTPNQFFAFVGHTKE